ncbi:hypothetical protein GCM10020219_051680 [Nonomuraea dietziae]
MPVTTALSRTEAGRYSSDDSCESAMRVAILARMRLARPTTVVCSCMTSGRRSSLAATPIGTAT